MATLDDLEFRITGLEAQVAVLSKDIRDLVSTFRLYLDSVEKGQKFLGGLLRNDEAMGKFKTALLPALPVEPSCVENPSSAFCGGGLPPSGALSPDEVVAILRENEAP